MKLTLLVGEMGGDTWPDPPGGEMLWRTVKSGKKDREWFLCRVLREGLSNKLPCKQGSGGVKEGMCCEVQKQPGAGGRGRITQWVRRWKRQQRGQLARPWLAMGETFTLSKIRSQWRVFE